MIGLIATLVEALVLHNYLLLVGALTVFLLSLKSRDFGLVGYFVYVLYFVQRVEVISLYSYDGLIKALTFGFAALLLLEDILHGELQIDKTEIVPSILILLGLIIPEAAIAGGLLYLAVRVPSAWGVLFGSVALALVILLRSTLESLGTSGQVALVSAVALGAAATLYLLRGPEGRTMFTET